MNEDRSNERDRDIEDRLLSLGNSLRKNSSLSQRVLDDLEIADKDQDPSSASDRRSMYPFREMTMFQRISIASLATSFALAITLWLALSVDSVSLAQVIEEMRNATSYKADVRMGPLAEAKGDPLPIVGKFYWRAPQNVRMETSMDNGASRIEIYFRDQPGIEIDPVAKTYRIAAARAGTSSPIMKLQNLPDYKDVAEKQLGKKLINGSLCDGFEIKTADVDPSAGDGSLIVWVNRKTKLPISVEMRMTEQVPVGMVLDNIVWNSELDDTLFSTEPPDGYALKKPSKWSQRSETEKLEMITNALKKFAALNDDKYPQVEVIYGDVTQAKMLELGGYTGVVRGERAREKLFSEIMDATIGWGAMNQIMRENPTAEYHGLTVGPKDGDKVLFQWKKNGATHVIYGDLRTATIKD